MKLKIINSNSLGNAYILENDQEALLIECGVQFSKIKQALNFNLAKVVGCIVTHEHKDHCKSADDVLSAGINLYATKGTHFEIGTLESHRAIRISSGVEFKVGNFRIKPFNINHDCAEPVGFLIHHDDSGNILFLTDSYYCEYTFPGLQNIIIEANYCQSILDARRNAGTSPAFLRDRVIESHMSLATCKDMLQANDLRKVNNIVLIHLSDGNSDARRFKEQVEQQTGKQVHIAGPGVIVDFNKQPF